MSFVAVGVAGAAVVGYLGSQQAASTAADAQTSAGNAANATAMSQYNQSRADQQPYTQAGYNALGQIQSQLPDLNRSFSMADFQNDPGYQFRMDQGNKAIQRSAAAKGLLNSGQTLQSLDSYSQGLASNEYNNAYSRFNNDRTQRYNKLASLAGLGQTGVQSTVNSGTNAANNISNNQIGIGNAQAASAIGQANNTNSLIGNGVNTWMQYQYGNKTPSYGAGTNPTSGFTPNDYFSGGYQMGGN